MPSSRERLTSRTSRLRDQHCDRQFFVKNTRFLHQSIELNRGIISLVFPTRAAFFGVVQGQNNMDCPLNKEGENIFDRVTGGAKSATDYVSPTTDMDLDPLAEDHCPPSLGRLPTNLSKKTPPTISGKSAENAKATPRKKKAAKNQQPLPQKLTSSASKVFPVTGRAYEHG